MARPRNAPKCRLFLALIVASVASATAQAPARAIKTVGIPTLEVAPVSQAQQRSNWCWAACIETVMKHHRVPVTQRQIVARSYGTDPYGRLPNWTGSFAVITRNLNGWGFDAQGRRYTVACRYGAGPPSPQLLIAELRARRPFIIGYRTGRQSGHAVVCTAARYSGPPARPIVHSLIIRDPWPRGGHGGRRLELPAAQFARVIMAWWFVDVRKPRERRHVDGGGPCPACRDTGSLTCPTCDGRSLLTCRSCQGRRMTRCLSCSGHGWLVCARCGGRGGHPAWGPCQPCRGSGRLVCGPCRGGGGIACAACGARGAIPCISCRGGRRPCDRCRNRPQR